MYASSGQSDYEVPDQAVTDGAAETGDDSSDSYGTDAITAPADHTGDELAGPASGEFADHETALDMPAEERDKVMDDIEEFAMSGYPYSMEYIGVREIGGEPVHTVETDTGTSCLVPKAALEEAGVGYDSVDVFTVKATDILPYAVGITAKRVRPVEANPLDAEGESMGVRTVEGVETKSVKLGRLQDGVKVAGSANLVVLADETSNPDEQTEPSYRSVEQGPLMKLDELRRIVSAIRRVRDNPEEFTASTEGDMDMPLLATVKTVDPEAMVFSRTSDEVQPTILDMPEEWHAELQAQMELYASSGDRFRNIGLAVTEEGLVPLKPDSGYSHTIAAEELAAESLPYESAAVVVREPLGDEPYSVSATLYRHEPCVVTVPTRDGLPVRREVSADLVKYVTFTQEKVAGGTEVEDVRLAGGQLQASYTPKSDTEPAVTIVNSGVVRLTQAEAESFMRLLHRANAG